jgi:protein involved in polysaccharide export with SLBB domain
VPGPAAPAQEAAPTFIERAFSELQAPLTVDRRLRQFGYSLFDAPLSTFAPVQDVPVGPDYVIAPGDTLVINMWGLAETSFSVVVDRNGQIFLPKAGPVRVWGLKFSEMETLVRDQLNQYFTRVNISVTMGPLRTMKVFILGDVVKPGAYTVSSLSTITNALFAAGGPSTQGSLRDIRLIRNNRTIAKLDLYKFLLEGSRANDERLLPDDTIFIPPIGQVVALAGYVKRPAIYELKGETMLAQLLELGGGLTIVSYVKRIQVERVIEHQRKVVLDMEFTDLQDFQARAATFPLQEGDFVAVFPIDRALYGLVTLEGNVRRPGAYALKPNLRVRELLEQAEGLLPGTYMARADLARFRDGRQYETVPIDLTAAMAGDPAQNLPLNQFDRVIVYHQLDMRPRPMVQITGSVYRPGVFELTPNMRVSDLIFKGSLTRQASLRNAEMFRAYPGETVQVIPLDLERILASPRGERDLALTDRDHLFIRELAEGVEKRTVTISGRVRYPGEYAITAGERLSSLLERMGGFLPEAFPRGAVFTRESIRRIEQQELEKFIRTQEQALLAESAAVTQGSVELTTGGKEQVASAQATVTAQRRELLRSLAAAVTLGRISIRVDTPEKLKGTPDDILLEGGDSLFIPQQPTSVLVLGAVRNSTAFRYQENERTDYYLAKAGGPTREADIDQTYILKPDGSALTGYIKVRKLEAGDTIVIPISTEPRIRAIPLWKDLATIAAGFSIPLATIWAVTR